MATKQIISKVWIAPGCIVCDACETTCPEVFDVTETTCLIRPEALDAEFCKSLSQSIVEAAEECPVEVIKFDAVEIEVPDEPAAPVETAVETVAAAPAARSAGVEVEASKSAAEVDPAIASLLKATTSRGGKGGHERAGPTTPAAVRALRARPLSELPPDARYEKLLEAAKAEKSAGKISRRAAITAAGVGWIAFGATAAVGGGVLQRFMMPNVLEEPDPRVRVGAVTQFAEMPVGGVNEDFKGQGIWIIRVDGAVAALSTTCTHLGCIPNWLAADRKFKCPCHGSGYMQTGINFEGPAPRPLERYKLNVEEGILVVDRSKKFQQEKGDWTNPDSFVTV
jgi:cytochrome b6-f complex iron-sulfur subunit